MFDINNLTPWNFTKTIQKSKTAPKRFHIIHQTEKKDVSINNIPPIIIPPHDDKTLTFVQFKREIKEPIIIMQKRRASLGEPIKKRKPEQVECVFPVLQTTYPIEPLIRTKKPAKSQCDDQNNLNKKDKHPINNQVINIINCERKSLKLHNMEQLKIKTQKKRRSHSQVTLHNLHYYDNTKPKPKIQVLKQQRKPIVCILKKIPQIKQPSSVINQIPTIHQTIKILKFDKKKQQQRVSKKYFSQQRLDHFLDKFLSKIH